MIGAENWKLLALSESQPSFSAATVVDTSFTPSAERTEIDAFIGALEKPYIQRATSERMTRL